jgi:glycosyltransferase involved in cell wall biosynthesis
VIRVAFAPISGKSWTGGYNYFLNLMRSLTDHASARLRPVLCIADDVDQDLLAPFTSLSGIDVLRSSGFREELKARHLREAVLTGLDRSAVREFEAHGVNVIFEAAQFFGWRLRIPAIAWIPDFQHRYLRQMFSAKSYWRRELGFRAQVLSGRHVMLSSEDARQDCERFYPATRGRTHVVHFAIHAQSAISSSQARAIANQYGLPDQFFFLPNQFWVHKNHECVIRALRLLLAKGNRVVVAASGLHVDQRRPGHLSHLKALIQHAGLQRSFLLLGLIPHDHVLALMRSSSALINPSAFEGWSTTVEEAKAMGTPMILSSLRVHKEQAGENAFYFNQDSPEQLARILETFEPLTAPQRQLLAEESRITAAGDVRRFADQFSELMEFVARSRDSRNALPRQT